jgi:hypothetical protein
VVGGQGWLLKGAAIGYQLSAISYQLSV